MNTRLYVALASLFRRALNGASILTLLFTSVGGCMCVPFQVKKNDFVETSLLK